MNATMMIITCGARQAGSDAAPSLGYVPYEPDPVNHETLRAASDTGVNGHDTTLAGVDDALVPGEVIT